MKLRTRAWLAVTASAGLVLGGMSPAIAAGNAGPTEHTDMGVTGDSVMSQLKELSDISVANAETGFRSVGAPGYEESVEYVEKTLEATGAFDVTRQEFSVENYKAENLKASIDGEEFEPKVAEYSEAPATPLDDAPLKLLVDDDYSDLTGGQNGCTAADYPDDIAGSVALVARGSCSFAEKAIAAGEAGAAAVILYNNEKDLPDTVISPTLESRRMGSAPTVSVSYKAGQELVDAVTAAGDDPTAVPKLDLDFTVSFEPAKTWNVIAETKAGDKNNVQMFGAHLDGVADGPGANDNGSGSAALLASAEALAKQPTEVDNAVRFGWWGAEEIGLVGSTKYVESLDESEVGKIKSYMNFDMIGSDNFVVGTLDSNGSDVPIPDDVKVPEGSAELEKIFTDYFDSNDQKHIGTDFSGRSDYKAFMEAGIPSSGLFSGADGVKTEQEAEWFGGTVGEQHDTNYHQPTDTIDNVSQESLDIFGPAIAYSVHSLAYNLRDKTEEPTEEPVDRGLTIDPKTISQADFVGEKGVSITATGCTPDTTATMTVKAQNGKIDQFEQTAEVGADGTAQFGVRGLDESKAQTYVGKYDVSVDCDGGDALNGSFEVLAADSDKPTPGGNLPRTGSDAMPLVASAGVLVALGLVMTMGARRRKV